MVRFTRVALIFNPAARGMQAQRGRLLQRVLSGLTTEGINVQATPTSGPGDATRLARDAVAARCEVVIACGGGKNGAPSGSSIVAFSLPR